MRKHLVGLLLILLLLPNSAVYAKSFKSCAEVRKVYKFGVSLSAAASKKSGTSIYPPRVNASVYSANKKLDIDRDGIVCEVPRPRPNPLAPASDTNSQSQSAAVTDSGFVWRTYAGGPGRSTISSEVTQELKFTPLPASANVNLKLWVHAPGNQAAALGQSSVFIQLEGADWRFYAGNPDGTTYLSLPDGIHAMDTIEPAGDTKNFTRKRYAIRVISGKAEVQGVSPNSAGFFAVTAERQQRAPEFTPANKCQLEGQDGNLAMNQGFPSRPERLPKSGAIRALIIPVDFPDVVAQEKPMISFRGMAEGTHDFYYKVSGGLVAFEFDVLPEFVRLPFESTRYRLGNWNGGDPNGYFQAALATADPLVDYSLFDVVYVLSPTSIPWSSIAYGPAFPARFQTADGVVRNGSISGADAYQAFPGAGWKWMAHETGHLFGLHDLYTIEPSAATYGSWDLMSLNWSTKAIELNSWNRFILDWLPKDGYRCVEKMPEQPFELELTPLVSNNSGTKAIFIPLSSTLVLVIESRFSGGFDSIPKSEEGVLVYTVDMKVKSIQGGWKVQRPSRSVDARFEDATLRLDDSVSVNGVKVSVVGQRGQLVTIRVG